MRSGLFSQRYFPSILWARTNGAWNREAVNDGEGNYATASDIASCITLEHTQNTDQYVDFGGANQVSASEIKDAYDRRGFYDADIKAILFQL